MTKPVRLQLSRQKEFNLQAEFSKATRRRFSERQVLETLLHQGVAIRCFRCGLPFIVGQSLIDTANAHWIGYVQREHLHEVALGGPDEPANCRYSCTDSHIKITNGTKATSVGSSKHRIAKAKRIANGGKKRRGPKMKSAGFSKTKRPMNPVRVDRTKHIEREG